MGLIGAVGKLTAAVEANTAALKAEDKADADLSAGMAALKQSIDALVTAMGTDPETEAKLSALSEQVKADAAKLDAAVQANQ